MVTQKPLLLKDLLELDSAESSAGFRCAPRYPPADAATVRCLLDAELRRCSGMLVRSRSKKAVAKLSAVVSALKLLTFASTDSLQGACGSNRGLLPPSLFMKLKKSFSKRRVIHEEEMEEVKLESIRGRTVTVKDIVRLGSFVERAMECSPPSPAVSCSDDNSGAGSSEYSESTKKDNSPPLTTSPKQRIVGGGMSAASETTTYSDLPTAKDMDVEGSPCSRCWSVAEEKERLSPVSVMDFPDRDNEEEEDDDPTSVYFQENLDNIQRTKHQLLQKIHQLESLAVLKHVDLEPNFASADEFFQRDEDVNSVSRKGKLEQPERRAGALLNQLEPNSFCGHVERLLLDYFVEGLSGEDDERRLLKEASEWMCDIHFRVEEDSNGEKCVREMDKRWKSFEHEEDDVGTGVETNVLESLLEELVIDLVSS